MGDVINLNRFRKARERDAKERQAGVNRSRFGRDKAQKSLEESEALRKQRLLDGAKINGADSGRGGSDSEDGGGPRAS